MKNLLAISAVFMAILSLCVCNKSSSVTSDKPTPTPLTPEELCMGAGQADAKPGYNLFSAKCFPNGTMCFKFGQTYPERYEYFVVFSNGRTLAGDPNDNHSIDDSGKVRLVSVGDFWRKKMDCYGGKELIGH